MASRQRILITDGETRSMVAAARGLHRAGFEVAAAAASDAKPAPAHWSQAVSERIRLPHPLVDERGFVAALETTLRRSRYEVLIPGTDASLAAISRSRARLESHTVLGLPEQESVERSLDKVAFGQAAARSGLPPPHTTVCSSLAEGVQAARRFGLPVILKPAQSIVAADQCSRYIGSVRISDEQRLLRLAPAYGRRFLVQRAEKGHVLSFAGVFAHGQLLAEVPSRYLRTWYPDAGNAAFSETLEAPLELRRRIINLLADLRWQGMFEVELIECSAGVWSAIDFNPRPYGSLALALGAGVNLPAIWCDHLLGQVPARVRAQPGVLYRWEDADLRHALWQVRQRQMRAAIRTLKVHRGVVHPYFELRDPAPFVARVLVLVKALMRRPNRGAAAQVRSRMCAIPLRRESPTPPFDL